MKKNILILLITIFVAALCAFCVSACRGEKGKTGDSGVNIEGAFIQDGDLYLILSSGVYVNCGNVVGSDGEDGENGLDGVGIVDIKYDDDGNLIIKFANGVQKNVGVPAKVCHHVYGEWIVETVADCVTQGHKYRICEECGFADHNFASPTGHDWDSRADEVIFQPETCTDEGWKLSTCANCDETKLIKIQASHHVFNTKAYTEDRRMYIKCNYCEMRKPSEGLEYGYLNGTYQLTGLGDCTDENLVVPDVVDGDYGELKVTSINHNVFTTKKITSLYLSKYITNIDTSSGGLFGNSYCDELTEITIHSANPAYSSKGNCIIDTKTLTLIAGCTGSSIPADGSVLTVGPSAFSGVSELKKITIPACVTTLGTSAFEGCLGLTEVSLGGGLNLVGQNCFAGCAGLTKVTINGVTTIGIRAFWQCVNIEELTIKGDCKYIGNYSFGGCRSLNNVSLPSSILGVGEYAFGGCENLTNFSYSGSGTWYDESAGFGIAHEHWKDTPAALKLLGFKDTPLDINGNYVSGS